MEKQTIQKLGLLCASIALCSAASWWSGNAGADLQAQKAVEQPVAAEVQQPVQVTVCVSGAVVKPGMYQVEKGCRAQQVIELAGGVTEEADMDRVNLAQLCRDGVHIKVPRLSQARLKKKMAERKSRIRATTDLRSNSNEQWDGQSELTDEGATTAESKSMADKNPERKRNGTNDQYGPETLAVHLNSATEAELEKLPGVGKFTARKIVMFRNKNGFQKVEDIMLVPGIGQSKFERMRPYLML